MLTLRSDFFAKEVLAVKRRYTGAGTGAPGNTFFAEYAVSFYWPSSVPLPPGGSPYVEGIIVGLMYDSHTPYIWAQEMRRAFPSTNLLTSKATNHGLGGDDYECQQSVAEHLESGDVAFVDGAVCGDDSDSFLTDFVDVFFESTEGGGKSTFAPKQPQDVNRLLAHMQFSPIFHRLRYETRWRVPFRWHCRSKWNPSSKYYIVAKPNLLPWRSRATVGSA